MANIVATPEQAAVRDSRAHVLVVNAFAGASKTTTCEMYAAQRQNKRILYLVFNKALQMEARARFPGHVQCLTAHGLAYAKFGVRYKHKLAQNLRVTDVVKALDLGENYTVAQGALNLLLKFITSGRNEMADIAADEFYSSSVTDVARALWKKMKDLNDPSVPMLHDGYLKLYQLSRPLLPYDIILLDEAQDTNPVLAAIVAGQQCPKVFVGDVHQQIYLFRGAINAMGAIKGEQHALTRSFRFGDAIADVATALLREKGERRDVIGAGTPGRVGPVDFTKPYAHICRTNAGIFREAAEAVLLERRIAFVGGFESYRFNMIESAHNLRFGLPVPDPYLRAFDTYEKMLTVGQETDDPEIKMLCAVVEEYGARIPEMISQVRDREADIGSANVILTTAHKSKGLEFDQVKLADDFMEISRYREYCKRAEDRAELDNLGTEMNLLYVSATRARRVLEPNGTIDDQLM